jgi:hypothetical protein
VLQLPLVVLFQQHRADEPNDRGFVREYTNHVGSEIDVALRSSRTLTTVPSRMSRTTCSAASERRHHLSHSACSFRQTRLTVSFDTAPLNSAPNARRTRRVFVPDK